jgi:methylenetetrahydrofolate reductase (NADPH)
LGTNGGTADTAFRVICEVRPPTRPQFQGVRRQIAALGRSSDAILVPENPIGAPTISSLVVSLEVLSAGVTPIAVLNARDRNLLGLHRDILTAAASGISELLFVRGDGVARSDSAFTVRSMVKESRIFCDKIGIPPMTVAVATGVGPLLTWKCDADSLFVQASFSLEELLEWRARTTFDGAIYAGVIVAPSASRARRWNDELQGVTVPPGLIAALEDDPLAGVEFACQLIDQIELSGAFDGVHIIPGVRYQEMATHLDHRHRGVDEQAVLAVPTTPLG